jgi:hypothetical protein
VLNEEALIGFRPLPEHLPLEFAQVAVVLCFEEVVESMIRQMGALSGLSTGSWRGAPLGVIPVARSSVAAASSAKVLLA